MKRILLILSILFAIAAPADAQVMINSFRFGSAYVGPLDAFTTDLAVAGAMNKRLLSSYTGPLIRIRRASDDAELDIGYEADGDLDTAAITAFVSSNSAYVVTLYDQSGNGKHATQSTAANQPRIVNSGTIDTAGMYFSANQRLDIASAAYTDYAAASTVQVISRQKANGAFGNGQLFNFGGAEISAWVTFGGTIYWDAPVSTARIFYTPSSFDSVERLLSFERDGTTSRIRVDGSVDHSGAVSGSITGTSIFRIGDNTGGGSPYGGNLKNFCIWKSANSTDCANRSAAMP